MSFKCSLLESVFHVLRGLSLKERLKLVCQERCKILIAWTGVEYLLFGKVEPREVIILVMIDLLISETS